MPSLWVFQFEHQTSWTHYLKMEMSLPHDYYNLIMALIPTTWKNAQSQPIHIGYVVLSNSMGL